MWADADKYTNPAEFIERNTHFWEPPTTEYLTGKMPVLKLHNVPSLTAQPTLLALTPFFSSFAEIPLEAWNSNEIRSWINSIIEQASFRALSELEYGDKTWNEEASYSARLRWSKAWNKLVHQYLRWALVGGLPGPNTAETMRILGRDESLKRLETAKNVLSFRAEDEKIRGSSRG
jgi:glutamyl-tRNA synthetase